MSLNFNLSQIKDHETFCWNAQGQINPVTQTLIFLTMFTGLNKITPSNFGEFLRRVMLWERVYGALLMDDGWDRPITADDITAHIGLSTNASALTKRQFDAALLRELYSQVEVLVRHATKTAETV